MVPMSGYHFAPNPEIAEVNPDLYLGMGLTAENVANKYGVSREDQDAFALRSHQRALAALEAGAFMDQTCRWWSSGSGSRAASASARPSPSTSTRGRAATPRLRRWLARAGLRRQGQRDGG